MKKTVICISIIVFSFFMFLPVFASNKGLPYDDIKKYTYFIDKENEIKSNDESEIKYVYEVIVRHSSSGIIASVDSYEVIITSIPKDPSDYGIHVFDVKVKPYLTFPEVILKNEINYTSAVYFGGARYIPMTWDDYQKQVRSENSDKQVNTTSFKSYSAIAWTGEKVEIDPTNGIGLQLRESYNMLVYIKDVTMPNGILVLDLGWNAMANGEMDSFRDYPDFEERVKLVQDEVRKVFADKVALAKSNFDNFSSITFSTNRIADLREVDSTDVIVEDTASVDIGETSVSIPTVIIIGVTSVAAAAFGSSSRSNDSKTSGSKYKMVLYKDFNDSIRYDKQAVYVQARIVEIKESNQTINRDDLTSLIEIYSDDGVLSVGTPTMNGQYKAASVEANSIPGNAKAETGIIHFKFTGEGGSFRNDVQFRLIGEPYIKFDEQGEYLVMDCPMILGDSSEYRVPFSLHDFIEIPKLTIKPQSNSPFEISLDRKDDYHYEAVLKNGSTKPDNSIFTSSLYYVEIHAETREDKVHNNFRVSLYPEGLSISLVDFDKEYALFGVYSDKDSDDENKVTPTRFKIDLVVSETDSNGTTKVSKISGNQYTIEFNKFEGTNLQSNNASDILEYDFEKTTTSDVYLFKPKRQIPEGNHKLLTNLPMKCEYKDKIYTLKCPVRLLGEPFNELKAKKDELDLLLKRVKRYMPPEYWTDVIRNLKENYDRMSIKEIRLLNRSLYEITAYKLLNEAQVNIDYANNLDWIVWGLEWVKWVGDQAFAYLATIYTGPIGEAILSPAKDIMTSLIAENIWYRDGITSSDAKLKGVRSNAMSMLENVGMSQIDSKTSVKKAGTILASFLIIKTINHYTNDIGPDGKPIGFYDALLAGFGDLTVNAMKFIVSEKFSELANSPSAKQFFSKYSKDWIIKFLDSNAHGWQEKGLDVVNKYITELCGLGGAKIYSKASQTKIDDSNSFVITFSLWEDNDPNTSLYCSVDLIKVKDKLYDFIFNSIFEMIPFPSSPMNPPQDPVFYFHH